MWMLTNAGLAIVIENISGLETNAQKVETELRARQNAYFTFILWATFGLSAVRFIGVRPCVTIFQRQEFNAHMLSCSACGTSSSGTSSGYAAGAKGPCAMRKPMSGRFQEYPGDIRSSTPNLTLIFLTRHPATKIHNPILRFIVMDFPLSVLKYRRRYLPLVPHAFCCYCRRRPFIDTSCTYAMDNMNVILHFLVRVHYCSAYGQIHGYKENRRRLVRLLPGDLVCAIGKAEGTPTSPRASRGGTVRIQGEGKMQAD